MQFIITVLFGISADEKQSFTFLNIGSIVPSKGIGLGPGIPWDSQYEKCHVKYLQFE